MRAEQYDEMVAALLVDRSMQGLGRSRYRPSRSRSAAPLDPPELVRASFIL